MSLEGRAIVTRAGRNTGRPASATRAAGDSGDLFALLRATTPGAQETTQETTWKPADQLPHDVIVGTVETPVGFLTLGVTARGLVACSFETEDRVLARLTRFLPDIGRSETWLEPVRCEINAYFEGRSCSFSMPLDLRLASDFGKVVLRSLLQVDYGETTTEAELARRSGQDRARRAVVNTVRTNPLCILLPCHRVVPEDYPQRMGGYAGGGEAKRHLLSLEASHARRRTVTIQAT